MKVASNGRGNDKISYILNCMLFIFVSFLDNDYKQISICLLILGLVVSFFVLKKTYSKKDTLKLSKFKITITSELVYPSILGILYFPQWENTEILTLVYIAVFFIVQILSIKILRLT